MFHLLLFTIPTHMVVVCWKTNLAAGPDSIHSHYQPLFKKGEGSSSDKEESVGEKAAEKKIEIVNMVSISESESTRLIFSVASLLLDTAWKGFFHGFLPKVERVRRETREASTSFWLESELMEWLLDAVGAVMGKTGCRDMVACRTGRLLQNKLPGSQVLAMLGESLVPEPAREFFNVVRRRLLDPAGRGEDICSSSYTCSLVAHQERETNQFDMSNMNPR